MLNSKYDVSLEKGFIGNRIIGKNVPGKEKDKRNVQKEKKKMQNSFQQLSLEDLMKGNNK